MKFKDSKGKDISVSLCRGLLKTLPNFEDPAGELSRMGLTQEQVERVKVAYESGEPITEEKSP